MSTKPIKLTKLAKSECVLCDKPGNAYAVAGLKSGYIDACPEHAQKLAKDALDDHGPQLIGIGDVAVTPKGHENPYKAEGNPFFTGEARAAALALFDSHLNINCGLQLWFAGAAGGARRIKAEEVDWERSGVKASRPCSCPECRFGVVVTCMRSAAAEGRAGSGLGTYEVQRCETCCLWPDNHIAAKLLTLMAGMRLQNEES